MKTPTMKTPAILAATAVLALTAGAARADDPPGDKNQCFWTRNVTSFASPDNRTVYVKVNSRDVYRLDLMIPCQDVDWNQRVALVSRGGGATICRGIDAEIVSHATGIGRQRCPVSHMQKLTPEQVAALPKGAKP
jgi:hypothetical protein